MIWFWIVAGLLLLVVLAVLLRPLMRRAVQDAGADDAVAAMFRRQLADIADELAQERLTPEQAAAARTEITRRMLATADRECGGSGPASGGSAEVSWRIGAAIGIAGVLPAATLAIYFAAGMPAAIDRAGTRAVAEAKASPHDVAELATAADQLAARLKQMPNNLDGWILLARTSVALRRLPEARDAYQHALDLAPNEPKLHAELGELVVLESDGVVTPAAEAEFARAADDPRSRFYEAEAALQRGNVAVAQNGLRALLADAPADAPWRKAVAARLAEIAPGELQPGGTASAGPTAQDVAAAQAMSPEQRQAMIRGMVERLAERLEQHPDDKEGWVRLAHAYEVLGDAEKAQAARARAAAAGAPAAGSPSGGR